MRTGFFSPFFWGVVVGGMGFEGVLQGGQVQRVTLSLLNSGETGNLLINFVEFILFFC